MSLRQPTNEDALTEEPNFELECLYDDMDNPEEVTIFTPDGEATASEWITVDRDSAVAVTEIR